MFQMIICKKGHGVVILVTPHDAVPSTPNAKYYLNSIHPTDGLQTGVFSEIALSEVYRYFIGDRSGGPNEKPTRQIFKSLDDAQGYVMEKRSEFAALGGSPQEA